MTTSETNGSQILIQENQKLRALLEDIRKEKEEAHRLLRKTQGQFTAIQFKLSNLETEKQRLLNDNRRFMDLYETQKKQKIKYLTQSSEQKSIVARKETEIASLKSKTDNLESESKRLKQDLENALQKQVGALKEKQNTANTVKILETKLEAAEMEKKYSVNKLEQLQNQRNRIQSDLSEMTKKYHEKQIGAQAIYRDEQSTKQKLLHQFQRKISIKDEEMKQQLERYINENASLKQQIIELESKFRN